jgi:N-acylneuraminate cytidylyltransferase
VEVAAVIPARGGKQSIKYKNLQRFGGKTLLAWAVDVAMETGEIDAVLVSTEDKRIAAESERLGAIVIPRPKKFSQPNSGDAGWYHQAVVWMESKKGWTPDLLVNLRPTSPLRFADDIAAMVEYMKKHPKVDGLKSVVPTPLHPYKMWKIENRNRKIEIGGTGKLTSVFDSGFRQTHGPDQPRQVVQDKFPVFFQDGQIDITRRKFVLRPECLKYDNVWGENLCGYVLDPRTSTDLDTREDFRRAEKLYRELKEEKHGNKC